MKRFAVIGHPIGHSLSPLMHNTAFRILNLDCQYELMDIEPDALKEKVKIFREKDWGGINVTVPHKESIMPYLDEISPEAIEIGAVNTVVNNNSTLIGYNTDVIGVEKSLQPFQEKIKNQNCVIIGSGGVARSITYVLVNRFQISSITFIALLPEQARTLINSYKKSGVKFDIIPTDEPKVENAIKESLLVINATAVGMYPEINNSPISNFEWLSKEQIVFDVIYRPLKTKLLENAEKVGASTIGGLDMFIYQGAASFRFWTGWEMPIEAIRTKLIEALQT